MSECPVCLEQYDLEDRLAKSFGQCGHSVCISCVKKIYKEDGIQGFYVGIVPNTLLFI